MTDRPTERRTDEKTGLKGSYTSNNSSGGLLIDGLGRGPLDSGARRHAVVDPLDPDFVHVGDEVLGDPLSHLLQGF